MNKTIPKMNEQNTIYRLLRGETVYGLDLTAGPDTIMKVLGHDSYWEEGEPVFSYGDLEIGLNDSTEPISTYYFALRFGSARAGYFDLPFGECIRIRRRELYFEEIANFLFLSGVGFNYIPGNDWRDEEKLIETTIGHKIYFINRDGKFLMYRVYLNYI